jgi:2'-5' RNA ligase
MRLFVALDLDPEIREQVYKFMEKVRPLAPDARWVSGESLHVTLKFIGEKPDAMVQQIEQTLRAIHCQQFELRLGGTGFFPTPKSARVFWTGINADRGLAQLARDVEGSLQDLGIAKENREFNPHLTLARAAGGSGSPGRQKGDKPNRQFALLQEFLQKNPAPDFGTMTAREFFLYQSRLSSKGSQYTKIAHFDLTQNAN